MAILWQWQLCGNFVAAIFENCGSFVAVKILKIIEQNVNIMSVSIRISDDMYYEIMKLKADKVNINKTVDMLLGLA